MIPLPEAYLKRMERQLGGDGFAAYLRAMDEPPRRALRINTLKAAPSDAALFFPERKEPKESELSCFAGSDTTLVCVTHTLSPERKEPKESDASGFADGEWPSFFIPDSLAIGRHPLHAAGVVYAQEPSAQAPAMLPPVLPGMAVLDLCAAPGGKSGQLAERMQNTGLLVANEPVPARAKTLLFNLERLGVRNAVVTNLYPDAICRALPGFFDGVLVDAPCSGEGMFRKEEAAREAWSAEHVHACALRQRGILDEAAQALRPGGWLLYATCTFSPEENEETVDAFLASHPDFSLDQTRRLYPHTFPGEGQFMALMTKAGPAFTGKAREQRGEPPRKADRAGRERADALLPYRTFCESSLTAAPEQTAKILPDGRVLLLPELVPPALEKLRVLRAGVLAGEVKKDRFEPDHALFLAYPAERFLRCVSLDGERLGRYFAGEAVPCAHALSGWCAVLYEGHPVGFGKAVSGTLKNRYPKGLRLSSAEKLRSSAAEPLLP